MAFQNEHWQNFYEDAWAFRAKFLEDCVNAGCNAIQAIAELEKIERKCFLRRSPDGKVEWIENNLSENEPRITDTNIKMYDNRVFNGNIVMLPYYSSFDYISLMVDLIDRTGPYDAIIELGCGYGQNLFKLFNSGAPKNVKYLGGEFTKSGVKIAKKLAAAEPKMQAEFFHFNHLEPKLPFSPFKRAFVFTCHSIEQVMQINENWFDEVIKAGEFVYGAHLEPFGFQLKHLGDVSKKHQDFMVQNTWNINFAQVYKSAVDRKILTDKAIFLEVGLSRDVNVGSFTCWQKN